MDARKAHMVANALTGAAGIANIVVPTASFGTGVGLFNIAAASTVNIVTRGGLRKKLSTCVLFANLIPVLIGAHDIVGGNIAGGLGKMSLAGASVVSCLKGRDDIH